MKTLIRLFGILSVCTLTILVSPKTSEAQVSISFQVFYDQLSPYGNWINYPGYGYVWMPEAGPGFSPYATAGHWVFTEYGWTWVSDYQWGWAAFHYGRWMFDPYYGWLWVPDTVWGPAWVIWRSSPGYYGWAPLRPGISINVAFGAGYYVPNDWWVFTPCQHIHRHDVYKYYAPRNSNVTIINNTTIINRTYVDERQRTTYSYGPDRDAVQKATGQSIKPVKLNMRNTPGEQMENGQLNIYRPAVQKTFSNGTVPAPKKVTELKDVKKRSTTATAADSKQGSAAEMGKKPTPSRQLPGPVKEAKPANIKSNDADPSQRPKEDERPKQSNAMPAKHADRQSYAGQHAEQTDNRFEKEEAGGSGTEKRKSEGIIKPMPVQEFRNDQISLAKVRKPSVAETDKEKSPVNNRQVRD